MTTELSDGTIAPGTNRNEALLEAADITPLWRKTRGAAYLDGKALEEKVTKDMNHQRNVEARKANKAAKAKANAPKRVRTRKAVA